MYIGAVQPVEMVAGISRIQADYGVCYRQYNMKALMYAQINIPLLARAQHPRAQPSHPVAQDI